jgi:EAL and modified HD-GYP domain-containing signal transduction protein
MCESLAGHYDCSAESGFMVGLFSIIDAMLNRPMAEIIEPLQISDATKQALTHQQGDLGRLLKDVIHYEQGQWDEINEQMVTLELFSQRYIEAAEWSNEAIENI